MNTMIEEFIPTRSSLLSRLKEWDDNESWRDFFDTYWKLIYGVALKAGLTHDEGQEVVQETMLAVAKSIGKFHYDPEVCSFKSWLLRVTHSRINNQFRRRKGGLPSLASLSDDSAPAPLLEGLEDPVGSLLEAIWDEEWQKNLMDAALTKVKGRVSIEQYQMFDLYVLKEWPVGKVARTLHVSVGQVYLAKHRVSRLVKQELAALETASQ